MKGIESDGEDGVGIGLPYAAEGFEQEAHPVYQRAAETARALVCGEEFLGQRAAMAGDVDAVEASRRGGFGGLDQGVEMGLYRVVIYVLGARRSELGDLNPVTRRWERRGGLRKPDQRKSSIGEVLVVDSNPASIATSRRHIPWSLSMKIQNLPKNSSPPATANAPSRARQPC